MVRFCLYKKQQYKLFCAAGALIAETFDVVDKSVRHYLIRKICKILDSVHDQTLDHVKSSGAVLTISQSIPDATTADDSTSVHGMFGKAAFVFF